LASIKIDFLGLIIYVYNNFERLLFIFIFRGIYNNCNENYRLRVKILRFIL